MTGGFGDHICDCVAGALFQRRAPYFAAGTILLPNPPVIAVVEDDGAMREALSELFEVFSLSYRAFDRAEAFLAAFAPGRFDCLVTDLHLPGISGLELQQRLKALGATIPVIVITSSLDPNHHIRAMQDGAFAYLTKPFNDKVLINHVTAALEQASRAHKPDDGAGS
jgi:FixJ family two-component response regulator